MQHSTMDKQTVSPSLLEIETTTCRWSVKALLFNAVVCVWFDIFAGLCDTTMYEQMCYCIQLVDLYMVYFCAVYTGAYQF